MTVFQHQSLLEIIFTVDIDLTAATTLEIAYKKPSGAIGAWQATLEAQYTVKYEVQNDDIDEHGKWFFQVYAVLGGKDAFSDIKVQTFYKPIKTPA
jgi:hypothetical protein